MEKCSIRKKKNTDWSTEIKERVFHSFHRVPITVEELQLKETTGTHQRVIDMVAHELITKERIEEWKELPGVAPGVDISRDIVKLAAIERHKNTGHVGLGFLGKYGLKKGAVATSIGHDSHNLVIAGVTDEDMVLAGNRVIENGGGLAIALEGKVLADLPLPIGGLMADEPVEVVDEKLEHMKKLSVELGISEDIDAFMTLAFISCKSPTMFLKANCRSSLHNGLAGEIAFANMAETDGNSTYRNRIIDAIYNMDAETLEKGAKYELR